MTLPQKINSDFRVHFNHLSKEVIANLPLSAKAKRLEKVDVIRVVHELQNNQKTYYCFVFYRDRMLSKQEAQSIGYKSSTDPDWINGLGDRILGSNRILNGCYCNGSHKGSCHK